MAEYVRRYWIAGVVLIVGIVVVALVGLTSRDTGAVMWLGGAVGVATGIAIAAIQGRGNGGS